MPDAITPVGTMIRPPDPNQTIGTLSGILGLRQQQQQLQVGQADVQQAQQQMRERQWLQQAQASNEYKDADGELDPQKFGPAVSQNMPLLGQQVLQSVIKTHTDKTNLNDALRGLDNNFKNDLSGIVRSHANDPNVTSKDIKGDVNAYVGDNPKAAAVAHWMTNLIDDHFDNLSPEQKNTALLHWAQRIQPAATTAQQQQPAVGTMQGPQGLQAIQTNPLAIGGVGAVGNQLPQGLAPQILTPPGGLPTQVGGGRGGPPSTAPGGGGGGAAGARPGKAASGLGNQYPGPQPTDQDMANFKDYSGNLSARAAVAADSLPRIQLLDQATEAIRGGAGQEAREKLAKQLQALNAPKAWVDAVAGGNLGDLQTAEKFLFQTTLSGLRQSMQGDSAHVAQFQAADKVFPSMGTDPRARQEVLNFLRDQGTRDLAEQQALNTARKTGTFNPATWQADYQQQLRGGQVPGVPASQVPRMSGAAPQVNLEGAMHKSKSGKDMVFKNGRWEYK